MWIEIKADIFEKRGFKSLNFLYQILSWYPKGSIPRYDIFIDLEKIRHTDNYKKLKNTEIDFELLLEKQFDDFINDNKKNSPRAYSISHQKQEKYFNIEEAIRFFNQPVSIILENNKNDAYFIKAIIYYFDADGKVKEHLKNGWIRFENAGGCDNVSNFIEGELKAFEDLASRQNKATFEYFRGLIIIDSDKEYASQPFKEGYQKLELYFKKNNITNFHILEKRMMENYMPDEIFEEILIGLTNSKLDKDLKAWINVYKNLSQAQKDHLKYYDGWTKKEFNELDENVKTLYLDQYPTNFAILKKGFKYTEKKDEVLDEDKDESKFKNAFPKKFISSTLVNKRSLELRANSNELVEILNKINQLL
jgi:hypothetical protein